MIYLQKTNFARETQEVTRLTEVPGNPGVPYSGDDESLGWRTHVLCSLTRSTDLPVKVL